MANSERYEELKRDLEMNHAQAPADLVQRYVTYLDCAESNKNPGVDITTGRPLKTFESWLNS